MNIQNSNLILRGGVDDLWVIKKSNPPELIVVDYKAQSKNKEVEKEDYLNDIYHQGYKSTARILSLFIC